MVMSQSHESQGAKEPEYTVIDIQILKNTRKEGEEAIGSGELERKE